MRDYGIIFFFGGEMKRKNVTKIILFKKGRFCIGYIGDSQTDIILTFSKAIINVAKNIFTL